MLSGEDIVNIIRACREAGVVSASLGKGINLQFGLDLAKSLQDVQQLDPEIRSQLLKQTALEHQQQQKIDLTNSRDDELSLLHLTDPLAWEKAQYEVESEVMEDLTDGEND